MEPQTVGPPARLASLDALFRPRSVAVVGASDDASRIGGRLLRMLVDGGFGGKILPVNPRRASVQDLQAWRSLGDLPETPDVAILAVPADATVEAVEQCAALGVGRAVVLSAGFAESGAVGRAAQQRLSSVAAAGGVRVLGPNCLGVIDSEMGFYGTFANALARGLPTPGPVAICSQSGAYGAHLMYLARRRGLGMRYWITTGNEVDIDLADAIGWLALQPDVRVIGAYAEGIRDGARFLESLQLAHERRKAVVITKVGASIAGATAAQSHTAALAGSDAAYGAAFAQYGVLRSTGTEDLLDLLYTCARSAPPRGRRLGVVTVSGGAGVQICDAADREGLTVPALGQPAQQRLQALLPYAGVRNPIDVTAQALQRMDVLSESLRLVNAEGEFDLMLTFLTTTPLAAAFTEPLRKAIAAGTADAGDGPHALCMIADPEVVRDFEESGFLVYEDLDRAVAALAGLARLGEAWERGVPGLDTPSAEAVDLGRAPLSEVASKQALAAAGVPTLPESLVRTADEAAAVAAEMACPVVLKVVSADLPHKSDVGGVELGVDGPQAAGEAFERIAARVAEAAPAADIEGVLVAPMAPPGVETIVGVENDPTFGPLVMFGLGGVFVEVFRDVTFRLAPFDESEAHRMIEEIQASSLLHGARGRPTADVDALARTLSAVSRFAAAQGSRLASLDINPLLVLAEGEGVVALDAAITPTPGAAEPSATTSGVEA
jgi:acyl-CoA synthetase (NDP forming)